MLGRIVQGISASQDVCGSRGGRRSWRKGGQEQRSTRTQCVDGAEVLPAQGLAKSLSQHHGMRHAGTCCPSPTLLEIDLVVGSAGAAAAGVLSHRPGVPPGILQPNLVIWRASSCTACSCIRPLSTGLHWRRIVALPLCLAAFPDGVMLRPCSRRGVTGWHPCTGAAAAASVVPKKGGAKQTL